MYADELFLFTSRAVFPSLEIFHNHNRSENLCQKLLQEKYVRIEENFENDFANELFQFVNKGSFSLCSPDGKEVETLLGVLRLPNPDVWRFEIEHSLANRT